MSLPVDMFYGSDQCVTSQMAKSPDTKSILELPAYLQPERANRVQSRPHRLDFLVVTEFTEHVGPEPLEGYIFPGRDIIEKDGIKLDQFATKLMSADYFAQANNQELSFRMPDDMHALISDSATGCYTLLYAFTLYDIQGRGYVRPLYLAYTSHERDKLIRIYNLLIDHISKAVHKLVHSNIHRFHRELKAQTEQQFADQDTKLAELYVTSSDKTIYNQSVCDNITEKLSTFTNCDCKPPDSNENPAMMTSISSDDSFEHLEMDDRVPLRDITELSDHWRAFGRDLADIFQTFRNNYADILLMQFQASISSELNACDCLNVGGMPLALLKIHEEQDMVSDTLQQHLPHKYSITSNSSWTSAQSHISTAPPPSSGPSSMDYSGPLSLSSERGIESPTSDPYSSLTSVTSDLGTGPSSLTSDPESYLQDSNASTVKPRSSSMLSAHYSYVSRDSSIDIHGSVFDLYPSISVTDSTQDPFQTLRKTMREVTKNHSSHIRDLLYTVMTNRPLVIVQSNTGTQAEAKTDYLASFLSLFIPHQHQADKVMFEPTTVCDEELTLKAICINPIIIYKTSSKQAKISENVKVYASIYDLTGITNKYRGIIYGKDRGMLDIFADRKHKRKYRDYASCIRGMLVHVACKAQLLHSINQRAADESLEDEKPHKSTAVSSKCIRDKLGINNPSDLNIIKNFVHTVIKQQYISSLGQRDHTITAMSLNLSKF